MMSQARTYPEGFLWGTATSAYQIEGAVTSGGRGPSIWDTFSHAPGSVYGGDTGDRAADHFNRLAEDVALMKEIGTNSYRFSISWSRLLPEGRGRINRAGIGFYRELVERLQEAGITPAVTLYHWDLPQPLQDVGGWLNPESPQWFAEYAGVAKEYLGDLVSLWATINEPWCAAFLGHSSGEHAPGMKDAGAGYVATHHLMLAHHRALRVMKETNVRAEDALGIVLNMIPSWPASDSAADIAAASAIDTVQNRMFLETAATGQYPELILDYHRKLGVADRIDVGALSDAREDLDYLGINFYSVSRVKYSEGAPAMSIWPGTDGSVPLPPTGDLTAMGWGVNPEGLKWILLRVADEYGLPLYVCENGSAYPDVVAADGTVDDPKRITYLEGHTAAVADAIAGGADVRGYFVWSLLDNFEWSYGYSKQFGLIRVDPDTLDRTVKASGYWYRDFIQGSAT